jgi:hypothetical protein
MDPITMSIVAALAAGVTTGATEVSKQVIVDGYHGLKALLKKKFGEDNQLIQAISELEADPQSKGRKLTLEEKVRATKADQDETIIKAAQALQTSLEQLEAQPGSSTTIKQQAGDNANQIGTVGGDVNITR